MKKIILSILAIALTVATVSSSAYALFSDTLQVSGITLATGNADLKMSITSKTAGYADEINFWGSILTDKMYPGYTSPLGTFWLRNDSTSAINLKVNARLTAATGDWASPLIDRIWMQIKNVDTGEVTGWHSLATWNAPAGIDLPQLLAPVTDSDTYEIQVQVDPAATNAIAGKTLSNVTFLLTGTQTP